MVTALGYTEHRRRHLPRLPRLSRPLLAAAVALTWALLAGPVAAEETVVFLTAKRAQMTPGGHDELFDELEADHGPLQGNRTVEWGGAELTFLADNGETLALGLGLELFDYVRDYRFEDPTGALPPERLRLSTRVLLYTLQAHLRWGWLQPFAAVGSGNVYVTYREKSSGVSYLDSSPQVWTTRLGLRLRLGPFALLYETGSLDAPISVRARPGSPSLQLGGRYDAVGLSLIF